MEKRKLKKAAQIFVAIPTVDKFCNMIKNYTDRESFPTTGKELQKRTIEIIKRLNR